MRRLTIDRYVHAAPSSWEKAFDNEGTLTEIDDFCAVQVALPPRPCYAPALHRTVTRLSHDCHTIVARSHD